MKQNINRRRFLTAGAGVLATPFILKNGIAQVAGADLPIPEVMEVDGGSGNLLEAISSNTTFMQNQITPTLGYSRSYLGPTLRLKRGRTARIDVINKTAAPVTAHWHGLHVPGHLDGGPQLAISPGNTWSPEIVTNQPASTLWYHSHIHGQTADQVMAGLSGMLIIDDPEDDSTLLPTKYGFDDIPLIVQDRAFEDDGSFYYEKRGPLLMHGFRAGQMLVNGAIEPNLTVPTGLVRLRLLNGSNARIYDFKFADGRQFHQVASDGGLLQRPVSLNTIKLAPAERAEILVDFSDGLSADLISGPDFNGGGMGRMMFGSKLDTQDLNSNGDFKIMSFNVDTNQQSSVSTLPEGFPNAPTVDFGEPVRRRFFELNMHVGGMMGGMMMRMMGGGSTMDIMGINGKSMDPDLINHRVKLGETEIWEISSDEMAHPFHIHGTSFQVLSDNGIKSDFATTGLKDVHLVEGRAEVLVNFTQKADAKMPYMFHCHILEHEDAGMMGQFTVS